MRSTRKPRPTGPGPAAEYPLTAEGLIRLLHFNHRGVPGPRAFVEPAPGVYDWEGRPPEPPDPGEWTGSRWGYDIEDVTPKQAAWTRARDAVRSYREYWPALPRKLVHRLVRRGWLAREGARLVVTPLGYRAYHVERFGRAPGTPAPRRLSYNGAGRRKHKPSASRRIFSDYRWRQLGKGRKNSSWHAGIPPHLWAAELATHREALRVRRGLPGPDDPDPPPRREWRRKGWSARVRARTFTLVREIADDRDEP